MAAAAAQWRRRWWLYDYTTRGCVMLEWLKNSFKNASNLSFPALPPPPRLVAAAAVAAALIKLQLETVV